MLVVKVSLERVLASQIWPPRSTFYCHLSHPLVHIFFGSIRENICQKKKQAVGGVLVSSQSSTVFFFFLFSEHEHMNEHSFL